MADWKSVGKVVSGVAPVLAGVLGGPVGALAGAAGSLIASFFGVEAKPEAVAKALQDPVLFVRLRELEEKERSRILSWQEKQLEAETAFEKELSARHQADMNSQSWLAKNVRPLCLLAFTAGILTAALHPDIVTEKLEALTSLGFGIYGYYFLGRSAFDKKAVSLHWGKK